jgi:AraC-like DNA-binding protein
MRAFLARPATDTELRHGYTLSQVSALSVFAVKRGLWCQAADFDERLEIAWHAIIDYLYTTPDAPEARDVIRVGWQAIGDHVDRGRRFYGQNTNDRYAGTHAGFERYWWTATRPTPGPEERVTDQVALDQIWPRLRPMHQEVLAALAAHGDYGRAAAALGKSRKTFTTQVGQARQAFKELWHEGETPSRAWGFDRRPTTNPRHTITNRTIVQRRRQQAKRAAENGGQAPPRTRRTGRAKADLGISDAELARRYEQGQSIRQLAASLGSSYSVVHRRLQATGTQLRAVGTPAKRGSAGQRERP